MAKTIYQRIALDGGRAILSELKEMGKRGKDAFDGIERAARAADSPLGKFSRGLQTVRRNLVEVGDAGRRLGGELGKLGAAAQTTGAAFAKIGLAVTGTVAAFAGGATAMVSAAGETADEILRLSQLVNATPEEFQRWAVAARQAGIEQDKLSDILKDTNDRVGDFLQTGGGPMADFFEKIAPKVGITADQFRNLSGPQALQLYVDGLQRANLNQQEMTFYLEAIASDATLLLPLLRDGGAGFTALADSAARAGSILSQETLEGLRAARLSLLETGRALDTTRVQVAGVFAPLVELLAETFTQAVEGSRSALQDLARRGLLAVVVGLRDLINVLAGNDELVRMQWLLTARDAVQAFGDAVGRVVNGVVIPAWNLLQDAADAVAQAINRVFGTDITGQEVLITAALVKITGGFGLLAAGVSAAAAAIPLVFAAIKAGLAIVGAVITGIGALPAIIIAALTAAAVAIYVYWDEIVAYGAQAWEAIKDFSAAAVEFLKGIWEDYVNGARLIWEDIKGLARDAANAISEYFTGLGEELAAVWDVITAGATVAFDRTREIVAAFGDFVSGIWDSIAGAAEAAWDSVVSVVDSAVNRLERILNGLKAAYNSVKAAFGGSPEPATSRREGFATGGQIRGPGTATSDSIPIWASDGEFMQRTAAVKYYGVSFMSALNRMAIPRERLRKALGYAQGGLVQVADAGLAALGAGLTTRPVLAGASVTPQPAGRPLSLTIGGETIGGLTASPDAAAQLERLAARQVLSSGGAKPSWRSRG